MYLPPESSVSCHLRETAGALRRPRVLTLRSRAHTKNAGVLPRSRSRALAQTPALPLSRTRARTQNAGAPPTHCARALAQNDGGTGFVPRPAFLRPDISTGCLCGRARCRLVFGCHPRLLVAAGIRLLAALPALRPVGDGPSSRSASAVSPARSLRAACRRGPAAHRLRAALETPCRQLADQGKRSRSCSLPASLLADVLSDVLHHRHLVLPIAVLDHRAGGNVDGALRGRVVRQLVALVAGGPA